MRPDRRQELATKWLNGTITDAEKAEFGQWYDQHDDESFYSRAAENEDALKDRIFMRVTEATKPKVRRLNSRLLWASGIAASLLIFISVMMFRSADKPQLTAANKPAAPVLKLANGRSITLNAAQKGIVSSNRITYLNGQAVGLADSTSAAQMLTLTLPKEMTYMLTLPDGSVVTLNAGSSLKYPSAFNSTERVVELTGEAFFEVTKVYQHGAGSSRVPFKVKTGGQLIEVLGTQFNVDAYATGSAVQTTLVEGSVKVFEHIGGRSALLKPGQQASSNAGLLAVKDVDTAPYTAWKEGYFYFEHANIPDLVAQLQRWYDLKVSYEDQVPDQIFSGKIPRNISLAEACRILNKAGVPIRSVNKDHILIASPIKNQ